MSYWNQKVVLVTGGSRGLGRAIAGGFSAKGARVVLAARDADALARAATDLRGQGADVSTVAVDVTDPGQADAMVRHAVERYGRLDALVNNVGISARGEIAQTTAEEFSELWRVNFLATVNSTRAALSHLLAVQGHVVNIGSLAAKIAGPHLGAYPASKFAVAAYSQQLRLELGSRGLHVLLVCPGPIERPDVGSRYAAQAAGLPASAQQPGGGVQLKLLSPDKVAQKIVKCCERRRAELIIPARARLLFAVAQLSPALGDWLVRKKTSE